MKARYPTLSTMKPLPDPMTHRSPRLVRLFTWHVKHRYLARGFHAVRLARASRPEVGADGPLVIVLNHPSWWDPLMGLALTELFPDRQHYAPIEAGQLTRYGFFRRLGMFGVPTGSVRGARAFLRTSLAILHHPQTALWITAQGRFTDPRERPPGLMTGVAHLVHRLDNVTVLPLALEYPFWGERYPEALARFGSPLHAECGSVLSVEEWHQRIEAALAETQDALAIDAVRRAVDQFDILVGGNVGIGGIYDAWRRLAAWWRGERFLPDHERSKPGFSVTGGAS